MKFNRGKVFVQDQFAGVIEKSDGQYQFTYNAEYLKIHTQPVSLTLPLQSKTYTSKNLFPFFDGLIPEGWLLELSLKNWKIAPNDRWQLLLTVCGDCIGNVFVVGEESEAS